MKRGHVVFSGDSRCDNWEYARLTTTCGRGRAAIAYSDWHRHAILSSHDVMITVWQISRSDCPSRRFEAYACGNRYDRGGNRCLNKTLEKIVM